MNAERFGTISVLSRTLDAANCPLQRFEHVVQPWVSFGILPVFALINAGVAIDAPALRSGAFACPSDPQTRCPARLPRDHQAVNRARLMPWLR